VTYSAFGLGETDSREPEEDAGFSIPAAMAFLGLAFVCCVVMLTGLPPLSGFIAKFALLSAAVDAITDTDSTQTWLLVATLLATGLAGLVSLTRIGMRLFWSSLGRTTPRLRFIEAGPVAFLLLLCIGLAVAAGPVMNYMELAAGELRDPTVYVDAVLPAPATASLEVLP